MFWFLLPSSFQLLLYFEYSKVGGQPRSQGFSRLVMDRINHYKAHEHHQNQFLAFT